MRTDTPKATVPAPPMPLPVQQATPTESLPPADAAAVQAQIASDAADSDPLHAYRARFRDAAYYSTGREWSDYAPAYRYGVDGFAARAPGACRFKDVESALAQGWLEFRGESRLSWAEARGAAMDAWHRQCNTLPGGIDRRRRAPPPCDASGERD